MGPKMQPEVVSREFVKPSSSTLKNHPTIHNLSFFDQMGAYNYVPLLFFYTSKHGETDNHKSSVLKSSLSSALSRYYPLAGRVRDNPDTLDCSDEGVLFVEARMKCNLSDISNNPDLEILKLLLPDSVRSQDSTLIGPVALQVTYFQCGGMSIGLCMCHKIQDMASMYSFIMDWASLARNTEQDISTEFNIGSLYPPLDLPFLKQKQLVPPERNDCVLRRLVFNGSKIAKLKAMVADQVPNPTRVEVVASLLYKLAISANTKASSSGSLKPSVMNHAMNLRTRVSPPLSERNKGNFSGVFPILARENSDVELGFLVKEFRKAKTEFSDSCANTSNSEELCSLILKTMKPVSEHFNVEHEPYACSSWCSYSFYELDFGWGKPLWIATVVWKLKNLMTLMDTREGGGIEAFISLEEKAMDVFENDEELLSFSCVNPNFLDSCL